MRQYRQQHDTAHMRHHRQQHKARREDHPTAPLKDVGGQRVPGDVPGPRAGQGTSKGSTEQNLSADGGEQDTATHENATLHTPPARQLAETSRPHGLEGDVSDGPATQPKR